ncbi:o-succinylbenzoate--CoA ligase [Brachybacterium avium]|uniref:O-succinylbenzoate--CoA ligase n=1 Tax=Brachybacterium avium TaxID=2017485 RepID=A0A220UBI9_9MICO|nr:class I adenylate-forming enzyme family protein [Brachybacterium avium]ASK65272.1 o-succinylbenzoate--CoA ligase [Brachybacterium avium]
MTRRIVLLDGSADGLLDRLRAVRAAGDVPLVGDERWPAAQWSQVRALAAAGQMPKEAAWATLTSGSSGTPRIVLRTAASWEDSFAAVSAILAPEGAVAEQRILLPAPPASSLTLFSLAHALAGGPRPVLPGTAEAADATAFHGTPQALRSILDARSHSQLRVALVGGSHLDQRLRAEATARGIRVAAYYGAAELSFVALDEGEGPRAFPGADLEVRDGAVWVRSPFTALGYLGEPGPLRTDGGWASVGDLASYDAGVLTVRGRADDAILTASATVIPEEVETGLRELPGIADAAVFGLPTDGIGALVAALVELDPGAPSPSAHELRTMAASRFATAHQPRVWFTGTLPRTASGKPARAEALRRALAGEGAWRV